MRIPQPLSSTTLAAFFPSATLLSFTECPLSSLLIASLSAFTTAAVCAASGEPSSGAATPSGRPSLRGSVAEIRSERPGPRMTTPQRCSVAYLHRAWQRHTAAGDDIWHERPHRLVSRSAEQTIGEQHGEPGYVQRTFSRSGIRHTKPLVTEVRVTCS